MVEGFFATLESELLGRSVFENRTMAHMAIFDCIEGLCNKVRWHSSVGNLSPRESERRWHATSSQAELHDESRSWCPQTWSVQLEANARMRMSMMP